MTDTIENGAFVQFKSAADGDDYDMIISGHVGTVIDADHGCGAFTVACVTCGQSHNATAEYVRRTDELSRVTANIPGHGFFAAPGYVVDMMVERHLPTSIERLRAHCAETYEVDMSDVEALTDLLVMLADSEWAHIQNERAYFAGH